MQSWYQQDMNCLAPVRRTGDGELS